MQYYLLCRILSDVRHIDLDIDNATLVLECRSGDSDAMSILYSRYAPRMLRVISRYVPERESAHDILHDGFIAAFTRLDTLRDPERLEFWLATIMKNLSLKFLQAQSVISLLDEISDVADGDDEISENVIDFATLESLIRQLPEGYQKVFRLAVLEGKSHKEISEILGIAPNSSSSQLFHAKLRLRRLIMDYKLRAGIFSLLLLIASAGILFLRRDSEISPANDQFAADNPEGMHTSEPILTADSLSNSANIHTQSAPVVSMLASAHIASAPALHEESNISDGKSSPLPPIPYNDDAVEQDSISMDYPSERRQTSPITPMEEDNVSYYDRILAEIPQKSSADNGWTAGISVDPGLLSFNSISGDEANVDYSCQDPCNPPPGSEDEESKSVVPSKIPARSAEDIERYLGSASRRHYLPISFALTAEKRFSSWLGIEAGIGYSYLHTDFERYIIATRKNEVSTCHWHYLEIPLKVNLYAYSSHRIKLYFGLGGSVAIPVYSYAHIAQNPSIQSGRFDSKTVWSVGGSIGASFRLSKRVDLFIEPSLRYHFPQECNIPNLWTDDEPFSISIPIGFRFSW